MVATACSSGSSDDATRSSPTDVDESVDAVPARDLPAVPSAACTDGVRLPSGDADRTIASGGVERSYVLSVPTGYDGTTPMPVVVDFHGYLEGAKVHTAMSELRTLGESEGFLTVTPQGTGKVPSWNFTPDGADVAFVDDLLDELESALCIDTSRVYASGMSNGAMMTSTLACTTSDRFAAVAPVAGIITIDQCSADQPVPAIIFHGTDDQFVAFEGGLGTGALELPTADGGTIGGGGSVGNELDGLSVEGFAPDTVPERAATWAERNGCDPETDTEAVSDSVDLITFRNCPSNGAVELYVIDGGGHSWPGSDFSAAIESVVGPTTTDIDATALMWEFFSGQRRDTEAG